MATIVNIAAYKFVTLSDPESLRVSLRALTQRLGLKGTILLSEEGLNSFVAGTRESIDEYLRELRRVPEFADIEVKESLSDEQPFNRMLVRLKKEIIAFGVPTIDPRRETSPRISAHELKAWLDSGKPVTLLDVRNDYEVDLGTFRGAHAIGVDHFRDFPEAVSALPEEFRDQPIVTFCTGGIRCEKAGPYMEQAGFSNVYQLDGGILKYFEECGGDYYEGDCFVFDKRVALDPNLAETDTQLCFACLAPLTVEAQQSDKYIPGESCPYCFRTDQEAMTERIRDRHVVLAEANSPLPGSQPYENRRPMNVPGHFDGDTVRQFLAGCCPNTPERQWDRVAEQGELIRHGASVGLDDIVRAGDRLIHLQPDTVEPDVSADIQVLYEDDWIVVVNKPAPLPMHPSGRFNRNTLTHMLEPAYRPQRLRPMHRLDANTSGVCVFARTRRAAAQIQPLFESQEVEKVYLAGVRGLPETDTFTCDRPVTSQPGPGGARRLSEEGQHARTDVSVVHRLPNGTTIVEARPVTGRTNQIRLHLDESGHAVLGDPLYGDDLVGTRGEPATLKPGDPAMQLFARSIAFQHPEGHRVEFVAPDPAWLRTALRDRDE